MIKECVETLLQSGQASPLKFKTQAKNFFIAQYHASVYVFLGSVFLQCSFVTATFEQVCAFFVSWVKQEEISEHNYTVDLVWIKKCKSIYK